jgi:CRP/FNR family cyclic AMP-dependent transcriptional regulator
MKPAAADVPPAESPFAALADPLLAALAARGVVRRYRKGTLLIQEGDAGDTLFIVLDGRLKVFASNATGREIVLNELGAGDYVGEMSLDGGPRSASVEAMVPTTCAVIARPTLSDFIREQPEFAFRLLARVIGRARMATTIAKNLALLDVYGRVARLLESMAVERDGVRTLPHELTHQDIADRVGSSREMVSRILKDLVAGGYVEVERKIVRLRRPLPSAW